MLWGEFEPDSLSRTHFRIFRQLNSPDPVTRSTFFANHTCLSISISFQSPALIAIQSPLTLCVSSRKHPGFTFPVNIHADPQVSGQFGSDHGHTVDLPVGIRNADHLH